MKSFNLSCKMFVICYLAYLLYIVHKKRKYTYDSLFHCYGVTFPFFKLILMKALFFVVL